jgi:hypothetical protein
MSEEKRISYWDNTGKYQKEYDRLWKEQVPSSGESGTLEGELIRAIGRLFYEYCNNGNCNAGERNHDTCDQCGGSGFEEAYTCYECDGEGTLTDEDGEEYTCDSCGGSGYEETDCSWCGGDGTVPSDIEVTEFYDDFLHLIENTVGCSDEVKAVRELICDTDLHYNYNYSQKEMDIYNRLCDVVIEYVLEKEKTGFTVKKVA